MAGVHSLDRIEGGRRILIDDADFGGEPGPIGRGGGQVAVTDPQGIGVGAKAIGQQTGQRHRGEALTRSGLADHADNLARVDGKADPVDQPDTGRQGEGQIAHLDQGLRAGRGDRGQRGLDTPAVAAETGGDRVERGRDAVADQAAEYPGQHDGHRRSDGQSRTVGMRAARPV